MAERLADPERELALSYAPRNQREAVRALWALDERFGTIVATSTEPAIGEMRLLWWREALEKLETDVPAEPLLGDIGAALGSSAGQAGEWGAMAEGWHALLQAPVDGADLDRFAAQRGGRLFRLSAALLGGEASREIDRAGQGWALADLAHRSMDAALANRARDAAREALAGAGRGRWPRSLRPLGALTILARRDARSSRRSQGAPSRVARMAWHRFMGW